MPIYSKETKAKNSSSSSLKSVNNKGSGSGVGFQEFSDEVKSNEA